MRLREAAPSWKAVAIGDLDTAKKKTLEHWNITCENLADPWPLDLSSLDFINHNYLTMDFRDRKKGNHLEKTMSTDEDSWTYEQLTQNQRLAFDEWQEEMRSAEDMRVVYENSDELGVYRSYSNVIGQKYDEYSDHDGSLIYQLFHPDPYDQADPYELWARKDPSAELEEVGSYFSYQQADEKAEQCREAYFLNNPDKNMDQTDPAVERDLYPGMDDIDLDPEISNEEMGKGFEME